MSYKYTLATGAQATIYPTKETVPRYLIYFHGGGFVYGSKSDIPSALVDLFNRHGYTVIAVDYLLAPNHTLEIILQQTVVNVDELKREVIKDAPFSFCGRSAGGYLMLALTKTLLENGRSLPEQLVHFYGYTDFDFILKERKLSDQSVASSAIDSLDKHSEIWDDPLMQRYLLYVEAIQQGKLVAYYGFDKTPLANFSIAEETLQQFPPIFSSASSTDQEVPFRYSKQLKKVPGSQFVPVYDLEHDFLKQTDHPQVQAALNKLDQWLI
ncbi:alpha/beta hydrolase [Marinilactibacillus kalidii]|uniref:alpha/beta hydrolase n=1 Tax=Marinilactibacillus kalidii TaxID=2820274 RepID=UPI001ABDA14A|nr:alpha/beta hydrolase [Marinilactibacillus kalidii]